MKKSIYLPKFILVLLTSLIVSVALTACSDDKSNNKGKSGKVTFDHTHGSDISNLQKHQFEHKFADQCVKRELKNSVNKKNDAKLFSKPCMCIARRVMKDLTTVEAEKFLVEQKNTQSLKMSFDEAAYFCLQKQAKPKSPVLFGRK